MGITDEMKKAREKDPANPNAGVPDRQGAPDYGKLYAETADDLGTLACEILSVEDTLVIPTMAPSNMTLLPYTENLSVGFIIDFPVKVSRTIVHKALERINPYLLETDIAEMDEEVTFEDFGKIVPGMAAYASLRGEKLWIPTSNDLPVPLQYFDPMIFAFASDPAYRPLIAAGIKTAMGTIVMGTSAMIRPDHVNRDQIIGCMLRNAPNLDYLARAAQKYGIRELKPAAEEINRVSMLFREKWG